MKLYIKIAKTKTDNIYAALMCDVGYRQIALNFDRQTLAECLGVSVTELMTRPLGNYPIEVRKENE